MHKAQRLINHIALVLDASWSMTQHEPAVVKATDEQIKRMALKSEELSQETRVSVYRFGEQTIECLIFDMDVMRLPSAEDLYSVLYENTALIDATLMAQTELQTTSQLYGDHAFLTFVLTDGRENASRNSPAALSNYLRSMKENESIGFLVPDNYGVQYLNRIGVLKDSITTWDVNSSQGFDLAVSAIQTATDNYMTARASGVRGTQAVFSTGEENVNATTVRKALTPLQYSQYEIFEAGSNLNKVEIRDFVITRTKRDYIKGNSYYRLSKREKIQASKKVIVVDKSNGLAYAGDEARNLVGLLNKEVRVSPSDNAKYDIYIQSTSVNRHINAGDRVLVLSS